MATQDIVDIADEPDAATLANGALLAFIGGFMDGFTYVGHGHVFANSMTGNVVLLGVYAVERSWQQSLHHLPPIFTFVLGIWAARALLLARMRKILHFPYIAVVVVELVFVGAVSLLPKHTPDFWITTSIAFVASMQIETFRLVKGHLFNSTFTTGNLRSFSEGLFDWVLRHNRDEAREKTRDFAIICLVFFFGAMAGGYSTSRFANKALLVDFVLLLVFLIRLWPQRGFKG